MVIAIVVVFLLGIITAVHAIMHTRTSQGAVAWAISLLTIPYLSVPVYWVLGRKRFHGYVVARRSNDETIRVRLESLLARLAPYRVADGAHRTKPCSPHCSLPDCAASMSADASFVGDVERMFINDFARSSKVGPAEYRDKPYWFRLAVRLARLTSPML